MSRRGHLRDPAARAKMLVYLLQRDGRHCYYCGDRMDWQDGSGTGRHNPKAMTFEHVIRACDGGPATRKNLKLACYQCNYDRN